MSDNIEQQPKAEIVLYQQDGRNVPVQVTYWNETFWLAQNGMADLFGTTKQTISYHLKNVFETGELEQDSVVKGFLTTAADGKNYTVNFYDLDAIIAVGYRVNSRQATKFRQWATGTLKDFIVKGFVLNDDMLKNGRPFGEDYFAELLKRIRDIRASERRFYQKITDLFQDISVDYDKNSRTARDFFANIQNRFHYASSGYTAAEIINQRADSSKPHMGLTSWKGSPEGRVHSADVTVAKNYLSQDEIDHLNQLVSGFLDAAELRVRNRQITTMSDCVALCDQYITFTGGQTLKDRGHVSKAQADRKAKAEFARFERTQLSDFDQHVKRIENDGDPWKNQDGAR